MKTEILFISDLHLSLDKPELTRQFLAFIQVRATQADKLYILGDLFDAWVGDDDWTPPNKSIKTHLKTLIAGGTAVYIQTGNRDFLLGQAFCQEIGATLLGEYAVIELNGVNTLLTHGDLLCSDDLAYQQFRLKSRHPDWQASIMAKPLIIRLLAARWYRLRSFWHKRQKSQEIMDVNQNTVMEVMQAHHVQRLIHGHTHRPNVHDFEINGQIAHRFVLPQWLPEHIALLSWTDAGYFWEQFKAL